MKIRSDESNYISYLEKNYPEEEFVLGRSVRCGEPDEGSALGGTAFFLYFGKKSVYFTPLDPVDLDYIEVDCWNYREKNILGIRLSKTFLAFVIDIIFQDDDENVCLRQFTCGRFDIFNKFNRETFAKLLQGKSNVLIYKSEHFDDFMERVSKDNGGHYEAIPLGFQVDQ